MRDPQMREREQDARRDESRRVQRIDAGQSRDPEVPLPEGTVARAKIRVREDEARKDEEEAHAEKAVRDEGPQGRRRPREERAPEVIENDVNGREEADARERR